MERVLLAVETDVIELTFQDESITKTLGVLAFVFDSSGLAGGLVIWTQKRVLIASAEGLTEVTFQGQSIRDTLGAVLVPPRDSDGGGLVIWTADRVLLTGVRSGVSITETTGGTRGRQTASEQAVSIELSAFPVYLTPLN